MKILAPLSAVDNYEILNDVGADEFFCGFIPYEWLKKFCNLSAMNRREYMYTSNICFYDELSILRKKVDKYKAPVKITLNSLYYTDEQYKILIPIIKRIIDIGFDTFIIADLALIIYLREKGIKCNIHLSGEAAEINNLSMEFFSQFHIQRFIFHRKNSLDDMASCIKSNTKMNLEYEAFVLNELCTYSGAFCNSIHCEELENACSIPFQMSRVHSESRLFHSVDRTFKLIQKMERNHIADGRKNQHFFGSTGCGVCRLNRMKQIGVTNLKVVGRGKNIDLLKDDIILLRKMVDLTCNDLVDKEFTGLVKEKLLGNHCSNLCYYL